MGWCCVGLGLSIVMLFYWLGCLGQLPSQMFPRPEPGLWSGNSVVLTVISTNHQGGLKTQAVLVRSQRFCLMPKATRQGVGGSIDRALPLLGQEWVPRVFWKFKDG